MTDKLLKNEEESLDKNVSAFYSDISETSKANKSDKKIIFGIAVLGVALGIIIFQTAALVGTSIALVVYALLDSGLAYVFTSVVLMFLISGTMIYFFQRMIKSWLDNIVYRNVFLIGAISLSLVSFVLELIEIVKNIFM